MAASQMVRFSPHSKVRLVAELCAQREATQLLRFRSPPLHYESENIHLVAPGWGDVMANLQGDSVGSMLLATGNAYPRAADRNRLGTGENVFGGDYKSMTVLTKACFSSL